MDTGLDDTPAGMTLSSPSSSIAVFQISELMNAILQFLPKNTILVLRQVNRLLHEMCTQPQWFYKDLIRYSDTDYLFKLNHGSDSSMFLAMRSWVRSVGFYRNKRPTGPQIGDLPRAEDNIDPESVSIWPYYIERWTQLTNIEISVPWREWTREVGDTVTSMLKMKANLAQAGVENIADCTNSSISASEDSTTTTTTSPSVAGINVNHIDKNEPPIRVWECSRVPGLREFVLHSSHARTLDMSIGWLFDRFSAGTDQGLSLTDISLQSLRSRAIFADLVSFRLGGRRTSNTVCVPWSSLILFLKIAAPVLRDLSLEANKIVLDVAADQKLQEQRWTKVKMNMDKLDMTGEGDESTKLTRVLDDIKDHLMKSPQVFSGIQSLTLLSPISLELAGKLSQAFPWLKSLHIASLDPFWDHPASDPQIPLATTATTGGVGGDYTVVYRALPFTGDDSLAAMRTRATTAVQQTTGLWGYFPFLERLHIHQPMLQPNYSSNAPASMAPLRPRMLSPKLLDLTIEHSVRDGIMILQSLETPVIMRLRRLGLIFDVRLLYTLEVCSDFLSRPCCSELRHLTLVRGIKILELKIQSILREYAQRFTSTSTTTAIIKADATMNLHIRSLISKGLPFTNHLRTLNLRGYSLGFPELIETIRMMNHFLHCCPHLLELELVDIRDEDVDELFFGLGRCHPEDDSDNIEKQDPQQQHQQGQYQHTQQRRQVQQDDWERPRLDTLVLDVIHQKDPKKMSNQRTHAERLDWDLSRKARLKRLEWDLRARFRFLQDLRVNNEG
ncbi:hypothetical protein BGZ83_001269 [Gryganskiella cystojenkinii]|nr:hypothetical protein BGZ83_001269 [Gryganskiella cystojenkinii]